MIEVSHLSKHYGNKVALEDVSFSVPKGQVLGLLGLNGAGKSTTMNILTGCLAATKGTVRIDGIDLAKDAKAVKRKIGYMPEIPPLYTDMLAEAFLGFVYELKGLKTGKKAAIDQVCERAGIGHVRKRMIRNLSKGYRQRVGLASAMLGEPAILILDEPTVGLDPTQIIEIRSLIAEIGQERTVILSSHILSEIQAVCERVIVLDQGRIVADDTPQNLENAIQNKDSYVAVVEGEPSLVEEALRALPDVEEVTRLEEEEPGVYSYRICGREHTDIRREVFGALAAAGCPLLGTRSAHVTLEDVFLRLVGKTTAGRDEA
ncbi:MAG: ATP-binding cassette domain-containing protein [Lachnospiraceae bacterium]|nr:ATP-binding cassette domain-containing protein [Lachnospiraceae bacterium]